jgi:mRNA-degrading endonuclease RelE of RelBE toxin-antitoxin system
MSSGQADVEISTRAMEQLDDFDPPVRERILSKFDDLAWNSDHYLGGRRLTNEPFY